MKKEHWRLVMIFALLLMFVGASISVWGIENHSDRLTLIGLATIITVCVSWWFWVMFVIRSIIKNTETTCARLTEIMNGISEVKSLLKEESDK